MNKPIFEDTEPTIFQKTIKTDLKSWKAGIKTLECCQM